MLSQEIENRERQMTDDKMQDERLVRLKSEYNQEQERLAELVREETRRKTNTQAEIELRQKQITALQAEAAKIKERNEQSERKENITLSPESLGKKVENVQTATQATKNKSILRGEGYYSSNNSNNAPVEKIVQEKPKEPEKPVEVK
jgi:chromosome segregation ATPase